MPAAHLGAAQVDARSFDLGVGATPSQVMRRLGDRDDVTCLSGEWGGGSVLLLWGHRRESVTGDPFETLAALPAVGSVDPSCVVGGGWFGYLGYALGEEVASIRRRQGDGVLPGSVLRFYDSLLRWDRGVGTWHFECLWSPDADARLQERLTEATELVTTGETDELPYRLGEFTGAAPRSHADRVEQVVHRIHAGRLFQANLCTQFSSTFSGSAMGLFSRGIEELAPNYAAFVAGGWGSVVSFSPELFLRRRGSDVVSAPIKGTRPRTGDGRCDADMAAQLASSAKDVAENIMIVDLMRNDLSRTAEPDSVAVPSLLALEEHPNVWHLASYVQSRLASTTSSAEILRSVFPPGSVTGAPKLAAMQVCAEVEDSIREVYTGSIGYVSPLQHDEWSVAIRTFELHHGRIWIGAGGGVTADSDPADEWDECITKVGRLIEQLGGVLGPAPFDGRPGAPEELFDTALSIDGVLVDGEAHEHRLRAACQQAWGVAAPIDDLRLPDRGSYRVRTSVRRHAGELLVSRGVEPFELASRHAPLRLVPVVVTAHDYRWKSGDRAQLDALEASVGDTAQPLLLDADGGLLETTRGNVFLLRGSTLATPGSGGRLLRGVTRRRVALLAEAMGLGVEFRQLTLDHARDADALFVTGSIGGIREVTAVAGVTSYRRSGAVRELQTRYDDWTAAHVHDRRAVETAGDDLGARFRFRPSVPVVALRPSRQRTRLLVVDNHDSFTFNLVHLLEAEGAEVVVVRNDDRRSLRPSAYDGLVVSPGPGAPADAGRSLDVIRDFATAGRPVLGICLGHQCIATLFGHAVAPGPWPRHGVSSRVWHAGDGVFRGVPQAFEAARYHSLAVTPRAPGQVTTVTAVSDDGVVMAISHDVLPIVGLQFHPESVLTTSGRTILRNFLGLTACR